MKSFMIMLSLAVILSGCGSSDISSIDELKQAVEVDKMTKKDRENIVKIEELLKKHDLSVLSASNIGVYKRYLVVRQGETFETLINPVITENEGQITSIETSLMTPGYYAVNKRPKNIKIEFEDLDRKKKTFQAKGTFAAQIQQEMDLMNGVLFWDLSNNVFYKGN